MSLQDHASAVGASAVEARGGTGAHWLVRARGKRAPPGSRAGEASRGAKKAGRRGARGAVGAPAGRGTRCRCH